MSEFNVQIDRFGVEYFSLDISGLDWLVNLTAINHDTSGLFAHQMNVTTQATNRFTSDLTENRDDVILAFLALVLMFVIEAIVTAILLRTKENDIAKFGFSIKLVIELIRDFDFRYIWRRRVRNSRVGKALNMKLICLAVFILLFTLGLEVGILFLTSRELKDVYNTTRTFRIRQALLPGWDDVRFHTRASVNRPCIATALLRVDGSRTKINGCVTSDLIGDEFQLFSRVEDEVEVEIESILHEYGADHKVMFGDSNATSYSARAFFSLDKDKGDSRLMKEVAVSSDESRQIAAVHKQYIAYLFTAYQNAIPDDKNMSIDRLNEEVRFDPIGEDNEVLITVLQVKGEPVKRKGRVYKTKVRGVIPRGPAALRLAQDMFRGLTAITITDPDEVDLFVRDGFQRRRAAVWRERGRVVNWLSMVIILSSALVILITTRLLLKSVGMADVAGAWVRDAVGANTAARPVRFGDNTNTSFQVRIPRGQEEGAQRYLFGTGPRYSNA